jgi:hypothetical protein
MKCRVYVFRCIMIQVWRVLPVPLETPFIARRGAIALAIVVSVYTRYPSLLLKSKAEVIEPASLK